MLMSMYIDLSIVSDKDSKSNVEAHYECLAMSEENDCLKWLQAAFATSVLCTRSNFIYRTEAIDLDKF